MAPLFDADRFRFDIEKAYFMIVDRARRNEAPVGFDVTACRAGASEYVSKLQALFCAKLFKNGAIDPGDLAEVVDTSELMLGASRHDRRDNFVLHLQCLSKILGRRGIDVDDREIPLKIIYDAIELIVGSARAITGHLVIDLLPAAARARRR